MSVPPKCIFVLEDDPNRQAMFRRQFEGHTVVIVDTVTAALAAFDLSGEYGPKWDLACLDHDLGGWQMLDAEHEQTGWQFCKLLTRENCPCPVIVHSYNPQGAQRMFDHLCDQRIKCARVPFGPQMFQLAKQILGEE